MKNDQHAFPTSNQISPVGYGMTLRDYFAAAAMQGMCANPDLSTHMTIRGMKPADVRLSFAESAYKLADEMLEARGTRP